MSNLSILLSLPIGIIGFLFLFWKRLKEDYPSNQIFSFGFIVIGFILLGFFLGIFLGSNIQISKYASIFTPNGLWFWMAFIFGAIGFTIGFLKIKLRFFETLEAASLGFLFWILVIYIFNLVPLSIFVGLLIILFFFLDARYKTFTWYKSGKVGFAGLMVMGTFFLTRSAVALINPTMLSFIGKFDAIVSSIVAFIFFFTLYNLSEQ